MSQYISTFFLACSILYFLPTCNWKNNQRNDTPVDRITINKNFMSLDLGSSEQLTAVTTSNQKISWSSNSSTIASVTRDGVVYGHVTGTAVITASIINSGLKADCIVYVELPGEPLIIGSNLNAHSPRFAFNAQGNGMAVWLQTVDDKNNILFCTYAPDRGWSTPEQVDTGPTNIKDVLITYTCSGKFIAIWFDNEIIRNSMWTSIYTPGQGWSDTQLMVDGNDEPGWIHFNYYNLAVNSKGEVTIAYVTRSLTNGQNLYTLKYNSQLTWEEPCLISTGLWYDTGNPSIAFDSNDNALLIWCNNRNIYAKWFITESGWQTEENITYLPVDGSGDYKIIFDSSDNALITWRQITQGKTQIDLIARKYNKSTGWECAALLDNESADVYCIDAAIDSSDITTVAWTQGNFVYARNYIPNFGWSLPAVVTTTALEPTRIQLVNSSNNSKTAVWSESRGTDANAQLFISQYTSNTGWSTSQKKSTIFGENYYLGYGPFNSMALLWMKNNDSSIDTIVHFLK